MVKSGQVWAGLIVTRDATGALATPSVGPVGTLYVDGTANGASVTITGSNPYKWSVTLPSLTAGQSVSMYITATIATIATASVVAEDVADTKRVSDLNDASAPLDAAGTRAAVGLEDANLDEQLSEVRNVESNIQSRLPVALVSGRMDASVGAMGSNTITAAAMAADAGTEIAGAVRTELATELAHLDDDVSSRLADVDYTPPPSVVDVAAAIMGSAYNGYVEGSFGNVSEWVPTPQRNAAAVRTELADELAHLDADVSEAGGGLTAQQTRDAMKLAPTAGSPAAGSVDAHLDSILAASGVAGTGTYTDTVTDGVDPLDNVLVQLSTDAAGTNMVYSTHTAANGSFTMHPDPGTYYVWFELAGYSFTQGAQVVVT